MEHEDRQLPTQEPKKLIEADKDGTDHCASQASKQIFCPISQAGGVTMNLTGEPAFYYQESEKEAYSYLTKHRDPKWQKKFQGSIAFVFGPLFNF